MRLVPGDPVPSSSVITTRNLHTNVRTDQEAYEADASHPAFANDVPNVARKSYSEAHVSPEAESNPEAVEDNKQVMGEMQSTVPEAPGIHQPPALVENSYNQAQTPREAEDNPEAVRIQGDIQNESLHKVPREAPASTGIGEGPAVDADAEQRPGTSATEKTSKTGGGSSTASSKKKRRQSWWQRFKNRFS